jgi:hypothetical protein
VEVRGQLMLWPVYPTPSKYKTRCITAEQIASWSKEQKKKGHRELVLENNLP